MKVHAWRKLILWNVFWMCLSLFLLGVLSSESHEDVKFPFDIYLEGTANAP